MKILIGFILFTGLLQAQDSFWGDLNARKTLSSQISSSQSADMAMFNEFYSRSQREIMQDYIFAAADLMRYGASGDQAMAMVEAFDTRAYVNRQISKHKVGEAISKYLLAYLEGMYETHESEGGERLLETTVGESEYSAKLTWGANTQATIYAVLEITNKGNGITRHYAHMAGSFQLSQLGAGLAAKVFHSLHKTRFPIEQRIAYSHATLLEPKSIRFSAYTSYKDQAQRAADYCQARNLRLATMEEMRNLFSLGYYHGGVSIGERNIGWAAMKDQRSHQALYVNNEYYNGTSSINKPMNQVLYYICAEKQASQRW